MLPSHLGRFNFITLPKIFGWCAPSGTMLELCAGMSELHRALDNGLVHIADDTILPEVAYVAFRMGFRCFINPPPYVHEGILCYEPISWIGIPVGLLCIKRDEILAGNPFHTVIEELRDGELHFPEGDEGCGNDDTIETLLRRKALDPKERDALIRHLAFDPKIRAVASGLAEIGEPPYPDWSICAGLAEYRQAPQGFIEGVRAELAGYGELKGLSGLEGRI